MPAAFIRGGASHLPSRVPGDSSRFPHRHSTPAQQRGPVTPPRTTRAPHPYTAANLVCSPWRWRSPRLLRRSHACAAFAGIPGTAAAQARNGRSREVRLGCSYPVRTSRTPARPKSWTNTDSVSDVAHGLRGRCGGPRSARCTHHTAVAEPPSGGCRASPTTFRERRHLVAHRDAALAAARRRTSLAAVWT